MTRPANRLVLDTNVVLDWLLFRDSSTLPLDAALRSERVEWHACAAMRVELEQVLGRIELARWTPNLQGILADWSRWARLAADPPPAPAGLRCTDADDQVFLDLALALPATALLTRDRALLRLAGPARRLGLEVLTPLAWARSAARQPR